MQIEAHTASLQGILGGKKRAEYFIHVQHIPRLNSKGAPTPRTQTGRKSSKENREEGGQWWEEDRFY